MKNTVIAVAGPTAVGKTKFAIEVARRFDGEVVSCDSMQLYKFMNIGSAKPDAEELAQVKHHLVDIIDPRVPFSVAEYQQLAKAAIADVMSRGKVPVISGGTGLYLNSLIYDMDFSSNPGDLTYRKELEKIAEEEGTEAVHRMLQNEDPDAAALIHPNNTKRIIRALERLHDGEGNVRPFSGILKETDDYEMILVGLTRERQELYDRINARVDILINNGLVDEVKELMAMGLTSDDISMKGIGYKEIIAFLNNEYDLATAVDTVKKNTRHYAKKQLTWYRRYDKINWLNISEFNSDEEAIEELISWLEKRI
ncbi:MAG: tRNA (adenosine(37)-N6)-dimethylallyltransferase MiaA [Clostridiales bacterium]|nr:tRNA (adenosine(37)-N6)-dimethylallyltransferase MiaA [Clostridiales bacterium]MDD7016857.1 tRNA (adenosine(37)-N6)-dimethylallyltransferase MiaA [Bacillota bacterium]MDY4959546.1 tRNA (adenosine(37)-N6)-dimethylallyltransferase MiaA [Lentihominibacter sp.]